ncbi:MAG: hypothetical protein RL516_589 [Bacteroidota bacterium]|jgi:hypothetical protein
MKKINYLLALWCILLNSVLANGQNCNPKIIGKQSLCGPQNIFIYTIDNYNNAGIYSAELTTYDVNNNPITTSILSIAGNQFSANSIINSSIFYSAMIVLYQTSPCNAFDTLYLQPCCENDSLPQLVDITPDKIPNIIQNGSKFIYNPLIYPNQNSIIELHGQLLVNQTLEIHNTTINVDQGGIINVLPNMGFGLINSTIQAGCGYLWQGIHAQDQSEVKIREGSTIRDAEYALYYKGTISGDFNNGTANASSFLDNYIAVYSPENPSGNNLNFGGAPGPGIVINNPLNLLPNYWGQQTAPQGRSFAGFYLFDNPNFNNQITNNVMQINIQNMNIGIANIRGSITLPEQVTILNTQPITGYTATSNYNGSAVYCEGTSSQEQTVTFGQLSNTTNNDNLINTCRYGVYAFKNVNVNCINNYIENVRWLGGVRVDNTNIPNKNIIISQNHFINRFYCAIFCTNFISANLVIDNNIFNTGAYYIYNINPTLENVGIRLAFSTPTNLTGHINNNNFESARIGLFATYISGSGNDSINMYPIKNNLLTFDRANNQYYQFGNPNQPYFHTGLYLQKSKNVQIESNIITKNSTLFNTPPRFEDYLVGIRTDRCNGGNLFINNNTINRMGTGLLLSGNCVGVNVFCNTFSGDLLYSSSTYPYAIRFIKASLSQQGKSSYPYNNYFTNYNSINRRYFGFLVSSLDWYLSSNFSITPYSVTPPNNFNPKITNIAEPSLCGESYASTIDAIYERVHKIIYNELEYDDNIEENHYLDKVYAYTIISNDSNLQALDPNYVDFINLHRQDNIGNYVDAIALSNEATALDALNRLNSMISNNAIEENNLIVDRIALARLTENRNFTESEIQVLQNLAIQDEFIGGDGIIKSRALLDIEYYGNDNSLRIGSHNTNKNEIDLNLSQLNYLSDTEKEKINVDVFRVSGQLIYQNNLLNWENDKLKFPSEMVLIKYFTNTNYIGSNKVILTK